MSSLPSDQVRDNTFIEEIDDGVKIGFSMRQFIPPQGIIYNYFSILKKHGYISEVEVFEKDQQFHIGVISNISEASAVSSI